MRRSRLYYLRQLTGKSARIKEKVRGLAYVERQEEPGYDSFATNLIHLVRRDDFSCVKVKQDGEVVLITANQRSYLNEIGNQVEQFGLKDYDYFFELFGVPGERRSGVYTANLDMGRVWM